MTLDYYEKSSQHLRSSCTSIKSKPSIKINQDILTKTIQSDQPSEFVNIRHQVLNRKIGSSIKPKTTTQKLLRKKDK